MLYEIFSKDGISYGIYKADTPYAAFVKFVTEAAGYTEEQIGEWPVGNFEDWVINTLDMDGACISRQSVYSRGHGQHGAVHTSRR